MKQKQRTFAPAIVSLSDQAPLAVLKGFGVSGADNTFYAVVVKKNFDIEAVEFVTFVNRLQGLILPFFKQVRLIMQVYSDVALVPDVVDSDLCVKEKIADQFSLDPLCVPLDVFTRIFAKSYYVVMTIQPAVDTLELQYTFAQIQWMQRHSGSMAFCVQTNPSSSAKGLVEILYRHMFFVNSQPPNSNCQVKLGLEGWIDATS